MPDFKYLYFADLDRELLVTRKILDALPEQHYAFKPHEKSPSLMQLGIHVATIPEWMNHSLSTLNLDVSAAPRPPKSVTHTELLALFDKNVVALKKSLADLDFDTLSAAWTIANGATPLATKPRHFVYRVWSLNHLIHHRAQLNLYLRLLNITVPTIYFNTADNPEMQFE